MEHTEKIELFSADNCKYGFNDEHGNEVIPCIYSYATSFDKGYALLLEDKTQHRKIIDAAGNIVLALECDSLMRPRQEKSIFRKNDKWGLVNIITNEIILPCEYEKIDWLDGYGICKDKTDECYEPLDDRELHNYYQWYDLDNVSLKLVVKKDGKWGLVDPDGKIILRCKYDKISLELMEEQSGGLYRDCLKVKKDGKYGLLNMKGELISLCEYDFMSKSYITEDDYMDAIGNVIYFIVMKDEKFGILGARGSEILPCEFDDIDAEINYKIESLFLMICKDKKWGVINPDNLDWMLNCEYEQIECIDKNYENFVFCVKKEKKWEILKIPRL